MRVIDLYLSAGILAMILVSSSRYNQRFGDMLEGTIVVKERSCGGVSLSHAQKLDTTESYEPVYKAARLLSEDEALLIKSTLVRHEKFHNEGLYRPDSLIALRGKAVPQCLQPACIDQLQRQPISSFPLR